MSNEPSDNISGGFPLPQGVAINPYTLAELITGRCINWKEVPDRKKMLEDILQVPYSKLFDPKHGGPCMLALGSTRKDLSS